MVMIIGYTYRMSSFPRYCAIYSALISRWKASTHINIPILATNCACYRQLSFHSSAASQPSVNRRLTAKTNRRILYSAVGLVLGDWPFVREVVALRQECNVASLSCQRALRRGSSYKRKGRHRTAKWRHWNTTWPGGLYL